MIGGSDLNMRQVGINNAEQRRNRERKDATGRMDAQAVGRMGRTVASAERLEEKTY